LQPGFEPESGFPVYRHIFAAPRIGLFMGLEPVLRFRNFEFLRVFSGTATNRILNLPKLSTANLPKIILRVLWQSPTTEDDKNNKKEERDVIINQVYGPKTLRNELDKVLENVPILMIEI